MGIILASFGGHLGIIWASFGRSFGRHLGVIWGSFGDQLGYIWASFGGHLGFIWGSSEGHLGIICALAVSRPASLKTLPAYHRSTSAGLSHLAYRIWQLAGLPNLLPVYCQLSHKVPSLLRSQATGSNVVLPSSLCLSACVSAAFTVVTARGVCYDA